MRVWAIVLAAGEGRRLGSGKLTLPFGDSTIIREVVQSVLASGVDGVTVALGHFADTVREALDGAEVRYVVNPHPDQGMLSSVKCGVRATPPDVDAFLIVLGDQPEISPDTIRALVRAAESNERLLLIPHVGGKRGHPVLFRASARDSILALPNDSGLTAWRESHSDEVGVVTIAASEVLRDIDTPDEYEEALRRANSG